MERKFLEKFGLSKEGINEILNRVSAEIGGYKKQIESLEESEKTLKMENETLKSEEFQQKQAKDMILTHKAETDMLLEKLSSLERSYAAEKAANGISFSSESAKKAFVGALMQSEIEVLENATFADISDFQKEFFEKDPGAFQQQTVTLTAVSGGIGGHISEVSAAEFQKMDYMERLSLKAENPARYYELIAK